MGGIHAEDTAVSGICEQLGNGTKRVEMFICASQTAVLRYIAGVSLQQTDLVFSNWVKEFLLDNRWRLLSSINKETSSLEINTAAA